MLRHTSSLIAAAATYLAMKIIKRASSNIWSGTLFEESEYTEV